MVEWYDPDKELPMITSQVLIATGTQPYKITGYNIAKVGSSGAFCCSNGPYSDYCLYSEKSPHRTNNAYRVIAWAEFNECEVEYL